MVFNKCDTLPNAQTSTVGQWLSLLPHEYESEESSKSITKHVPGAAFSLVSYPPNHDSKIQFSLIHL